MRLSGGIRYGKCAILGFLLVLVRPGALHTLRAACLHSIRVEFSLLTAAVGLRVVIGTHVAEDADPTATGYLVTSSSFLTAQFLF